ncbi:oxysterol-binding protein-related protein 1-like isoform X2 [Ruditapes philippinarum]|uniref:oxysterol-binding protein-related protein 1-like isoform X2 n=1 Tax=Ruditapes philippinarum TaxID=129788 RepID=UPI00295B7A39|nr:oxysterol-binding protein-related protein 1-like isoform X2 [Ruditapes philippinarum]
MSGTESTDEEISLEESLLLCSRRGQANIIRDILQSKKEGKVDLDINCKGSQKANRGWTPLHLASYFGHPEVVQILLEYGVSVNVVNNVGDTALHKAAHTGRLDVVTLLLQHGADVSIINAEGSTAKSLAKTPEIQRLIRAAEEHDASRLEEEFISSVRLGQIEHIEHLMLDGRFNGKINCQDSFGNTALHVAAQAGQKEVAVYLLQQGLDTGTKNKQGFIPAEVAKTEQMKQLLHVKPKKDVIKIPARYEGLLIKKKFVRSKPLWVVLERGVLSYFHNRGDASTGSKRRGMKYLDNAHLMVSEENSYDFMIRFSDGTNHKLGVDPGAKEVQVGRDPTTGEIVTRQMWINSLKEHINYNTHYIHKGEMLKTESFDQLSVVTMQTALQEAQAHQDVLDSHVSQLCNYLTRSQQTSKLGNVVHLEEELQKTVKYSQDMCSSLNKCLNVYTQEQEEREKLLHEEKEKNRVLQEALHALAIEHHELERTYSHNIRARSFSIDDDEFFDCDDLDEDVDIHLPLSPTTRSMMSDNLSFKSCQVDLEGGNRGRVSPLSSIFHYHVQLGGRKELPKEMFDRNDFSFWSILKQCIGKELSKITMPVVFNEPLTFLQRITEYLEYSTLINTASMQDDPADRMMYVAAFAVSAISSNWDRIGKPFNPLLGETFELNRPDLGFRLVTEQVCHHPPISAFHVESDVFKFHGSIHPKLKFWGKSVEINPKGVITLELLKHGEIYTWQNVNCCVHNVIVGKIWIEHTGVMEVINHKTKHKAVLNFKQGGWFGKDLHKVEGFVYDFNKQKVKSLYGSWVYDLFGIDNSKYEEFLSSKPISPKHTVSENGNNDSEVEDNIPTHHFSTFNLNIPDQVVLWRATPRPEKSDKYFSFTAFAIALNELKDFMLDTLPPTDSRLRPDVRILEEGNIDLAGEEKNRLEEKQRAARRERKKRRDEWTPQWFKLERHPVTQKEDWLYTGKYWDKDWTKCPDIF